MRTVVGLLIAAVVGIHCSVPSESAGTSAPQPNVAFAAPGVAREPAASGEPKSPDHVAEVTVGLPALMQDAINARMTSAVVDPSSGATFATGTFVDEIVIGGVHLKSHGEADVFLLKVGGLGDFQWVRAVGSAFAESGPRVTLDGSHVNLIGMTTGTMDCGMGPLARWSSDTFFLCVCEAADGTPVSGGVFPTGAP